MPALRALGIGVDDNPRQQNDGEYVGLFSDAKSGGQADVDSDAGGSAKDVVDAAQGGKVGLDSTNVCDAPTLDLASLEPGAGGAGQAEAPEGLVDYYMKSNWDSSVYEAHHARIGGVPNLLGTPMLPPPTMSDGAGVAANLIASFGSGLVDSVVWGALKAIPLLGMAPMLLDSIKDTRDAFGDYSTTDDSGLLAETVLGVRLLSPSDGWLRS